MSQKKEKKKSILGVYVLPGRNVETGQASKRINQSSGPQRGNERELGKSKKAVLLVEKRKRFLVVQLLCLLLSDKFTSKVVSNNSKM